MKKKLISVVGARPNFMKVAPLASFLRNHKVFDHIICHTGQHFDPKMSKIFFEELNIEEPKYNLGISGGSPINQIASIMIEFEKVLLNEKPDMVLVYGDVNSTLACSLTAVRNNIQVAHIEAGLRSFDTEMPEEINRIITDSISNLLFITEESASENLKREGYPSGKIFFVGNIMIDTLVKNLPVIRTSKILEKFSLSPGGYILMTMHRPSNVDTEMGLIDLVDLLTFCSGLRKVIFPIHPRTKNNLMKYNLLNKLPENVSLIEPLGYHDFISLIDQAYIVVTDSGGIQEETTFLGVPCVTVRKNTERPVTVQVGTNILAGINLKEVKSIISDISHGKIKKGKIPELWDGNTASRIVGVLEKTLFINQGMSTNASVNS